MADPTKYVPGYSFSGFQAVNPNRPLPANSLDAEFAALMASFDETVEAIKDVRRADGKLHNGSVGPDQLSSTLSIGFTNRGTWAVGESYAAGDGAAFGQMFYSARVAHVATSGTQPDLAPGTWRVLFSFASISLVDGSIGTAKYGDGSLTLAKMASMPTSTIIGRSAAGTGAPQYLDPAAARTAIQTGPKPFTFTVTGGDETSPVGLTSEIRSAVAFVAIAPAAIVAFDCSVASFAASGFTAFMRGSVRNTQNGFQEAGSTTEQVVVGAGQQVLSMARTLVLNNLTPGVVYQAVMQIRASTAGTFTPQGMMISGFNA